MSEAIVAISISPELLSEKFKKDADSINSEELYHSGWLKERAEKEIEDFKIERERKLKEELDASHNQSRKKYEARVDAYLTELLKSIPVQGKAQKPGTEEDERMIAALNAYVDSHGYFGLTVRTRFVKRAGALFTMLYAENASRWRRKFGARKEIQEPIGHFFSRIPYSISFSSLGTHSGKSGKAKVKEPKEKSFSIAQTLFGDDVCFSHILEFDEVYTKKLEAIRIQKHEEAAGCRDREKKISEILFNHVRKVAPTTITDDEISGSLKSLSLL